MLAAAASLPLSLGVLSLFFLEESPYWLVTNRRIDEAREVVRVMMQLNAPAANTPHSARPSWPSERETESVEELLKQLQPPEHLDQWQSPKCCCAAPRAASEEDPLLGEKAATSSSCCCEESWRFKFLFS